MQTIYIFFNNNLAAETLQALCEALGYLAIIISNKDLKKLKNKIIKDIIFTDFITFNKLFILANKDQYKGGVVVFLTHGLTVNDIGISSKVVKFYKELTLNNVKQLITEFDN